MGIFGGNYMKEGPGVSKNAKKKRGFFLYVDIIIQKFTKILGTNMLYALVSLPYLLLCYFILSRFVLIAFGADKLIELTVESIGGTEEEAAASMQYFYLLFSSMVTMLLFNFFGSGPASASYAYIMRCYTRGEHAWILSDGWDKFKENIKYSLLMLVLDIVVILLGSNAISFYRAFAQQMQGGMSTLFSMIQYFTVVVMFLYMMMHMYVYQIMVTYDCKFGELLKASAMMTLAKLPMSVLLTAISMGIIMMMFMTIGNPMLSIILYIILGIMFFRYPFEFYASRVIEKNIKAVKKANNKNEAKITYLEDESEDESEKVEEI